MRPARGCAKVLGIFFRAGQAASALPGLKPDGKADFKVLRYVNRFRRGVLDAQEALRESGNPPARYAFEPASVTVSAYKS